MPVLVEHFGGVDGQGRPQTLHGRVRLVEPAGFTKVSALGVEEQRVPIVVDPAEPLAAWRVLGDGYRVEQRIIVDQADDVILVPTGALFRDGASWAAFVVAGGRARRRPVAVGRIGPNAAEVLGGLAPGDAVVLYPDELLRDGDAIAPR
jgi:HlyD family secretion protein